MRSPPVATLGRKFFKTKLCKLYQGGGRCPRQNCSFAHGYAELRHVPGPFNDRRDYRNGDLRSKLDRRYSPHRRYSPGRDARGYHAFHSQKPLSHDRGYSVSRSPVRRSDRRHKKRQHLDGESDDSGSYKIPSGAEDKMKEDEVSSDDKDDLKEQLKKTNLEIELQHGNKSELQMLLNEKVDDARKLSTRIEDLEMQLNKEQENCKRITSKIKKFVKAHWRYSKAQEDLKRSQTRLQRIGELLGSDILKPNLNEEDSSANIASDGEPNGEEVQNNASIKKRQHVYPATNEEVQTGNFQKRKRFAGVFTKSEKLSTAEGPLPPSETDKETEAKKMARSKKDFHKSFADDYRNKRGKIIFSSIGSLDKVKGPEVGRSLPSTSMAAHAADELIEAIEMDEKSETVEAAAAGEIGGVNNRASLSYMPPPPPPATQNAYKQYEGDDEDVDVVDSEMVDIDINSEIEI